MLTKIQRLTSVQKNIARQSLQTIAGVVGFRALASYFAGVFYFYGFYFFYSIRQGGALSRA